MLDVLLAIKNNNMRKIPNYDPTHLDHMRKMLRTYVRGEFKTMQLLNNGDESSIHFFYIHVSLMDVRTRILELRGIDV